MISCKNLQLKTPEKVFVKNLDLKLNINEFWAILGNNGTGKSTLINSLFGLHSDYLGDIKIKDQDVQSYSLLERAQMMALLNQQQEPNLDGSIEQMVRFGRYPWAQNMALSEEDLNLVSTALKFTGLTKLKNRQLHQLSGGEQRKAELATILAQDSSIFLLDEPTNHMDLSFKLKFMQQLKLLQAKKLIVMVTHDIHFVQKYCTHILFLGNKGSWTSGQVKDVFTEKNIEQFLQIKLSDVYQ